MSEAALLRIVFDTNVYISALLHGELADVALELASAGKLALISSTAILDELTEKLRDKFDWSQQSIDLYLAALQDVVEVVEVKQRLKVIADDDDNRILECAVAGRADLIVTYDKHLLRLDHYEEVGIITPLQLSYYGLDKIK